ncbi:S1 RNA-binding domain-containing protein, partial [bacterium]|nr:S1 RNA-binding domain-containing protein [bacterium]
IENPEEYVGRRLEFRITQFSEGGRNVVVSRRKLLDEQRSLSEGAFLDENHVGTVMRGQVTRMEKFGAFVRLDSGLEGLLHISELSWSRVNDPSEVLRVGQEVFVKVLKADDKEGHLKISLSLKQAQAEPWSQLPTHIQAGSVVSGKVTRCMKFGAFVELIPGVEGLIPLSEMSYTKRVVRSDELVHEGETVSVMIKELNSSDRKILLSLKDAGADPWALVPQKFPVGAIIKGQVERREPYGLFVKLDDGVVALLSKSKALEESSFNFEKVKLGEEIFVQVAELNLDQRRISLSVPRDPEAGEWKSYTQTSTGSFGTLGDQFSKLLSQKKKS